MSLFYTFHLYPDILKISHALGTLELQQNEIRKGDDTMFMENREILSAQQVSDINTTHEMEGRQEEIDQLNELIATNLGMTKLYETAANNLDHEDNARLLREYTVQHKTFVKELSNQVVSLGGKPVTSADGSSLIKRAWVTLKAAITSGDSNILMEIIQDLENVLEAYSETMSQRLTDSTRDLIRDHISKIRLAYKKILALGAVYANLDK
jgi:uncharacterized protein (TIGR02284 family)